MNIGIFGGLFDPPHIGHLIIAQSILEEFNLDTIVFIPAGHPPHKARYSPYHVRSAMTALAITGNKKFSMSDVEKTMVGKTYTVEVLKKLRETWQGTFYLINDSDQWQEIETWKTPEELFTECHIIVVPRPHYVIKKSSRFFKKILIGNSPLIDISSTMIRAYVEHGHNIQYLVPLKVYTYIKRKKLYRQ
jgi:nicotinate-nucleotide adenylyltransferase